MNARTLLPLHLVVASLWMASLLGNLATAVFPSLEAGTGLLLRRVLQTMLLIVLVVYLGLLLIVRIRARRTRSRP